MKNLSHTIICMLAVALLAALGAPKAQAQERETATADTLATEKADSVKLAIPFEDEGVKPVVFGEEQNDSTPPTKAKEKRKARQKTELADTTMLASVSRGWKRPSPKRAMWLAMVLPGAGQIYNNKLWKLPIFYGGFLGCIYALRWNNQQYKDYSQAYLDIMDDDPNTQSYNQYLHVGRSVEKNNESYYKELFKKRKDFYRRYRDMSFFVMIGVYALSVIDAYVDASLAQFDISEDLSLHVAPSVINSQMSSNPFRSSALGLQCSLNF